ncbi:MAG: P-loop NTPase [Haloferacaceae archaeon]
MSESDTDLRDAVTAALGEVRDPEADADVLRSGAVDDVVVEGSSVTVEADLARVGTATGVVEDVLAAARGVPGVESVHVEPAAADTTGRTSLAGVENVVAVASTKGGVGKTTVATNLACALAADREVGLFDADIFGPNAPELLGVRGPIVADEDDNPIPSEVAGMEVLSVGLMTDGGPLAWRGAMAHDALSDLFANAQWGNTDAAVIDLPPGTSDVALTTLQEVRVDGVVFVTTPFHTSVEDTKRSLRLFRENGVPVLGVVVNMDGFVCEECGHPHDLFERGPLDDLDVPVLSRLPFSKDLQGDPRPGETPGAFADLAADVADALSDVERIELPEDPVDLRGEPPESRFELVSDAFAAAEPGADLHVVSDRDPTPAGDFLVDLAGEKGSPGEVFETFLVEQRGPEQWALRATLPGSDGHSHDADR